MKLVELLAKELSEWPAGSGIAVQDGDKQKTVKFGHSTAEPKIAFLGRENTWQTNNWGFSSYSDFDHSVLASDWETAIVTEEQWQAERDRQKGGEWKRHRAGRKQPVPDRTKIEAKFRDGEIHTVMSDRVDWIQYGHGSDLMQYRVISQPQAEEVEVNVFVGKDVKIEYAYAQEGVEPEHLEWKTMGTAKIDSICNLGSTEAKTDQIDGPIKWRDTVNELDAYIEGFTREREALINRLAEEGFALLPDMNAVMGVANVDMSDWRNWKSGDIVECLTDSYRGVYTKGQQYKVKSVNRNDFDVFDDLGEQSSCGWDDADCDGLKFVSRP